ncbi:hypothetical protein GCM10008090_29960 [Arenicella chitinivorans]|uniref:DUF2244 domain-containing protein n=1 Tax=Arenicella chitinivorans TaxID=1329800 RepID=A0A918S329_9GAMM|nr:DUF2244 domain-containing protein [Arenicella chitinivorans]GHA18385.1 hypothetical protein GCM10008090_29960 [Arenicella chitinivorans]
MVETHIVGKQIQLIMSPNRSMSWQTNKKILIAMFVVNMTIAACWAWMGAWMVLPFAGLEVMLVGIGMYYVSWKLSFKEILLIEEQSLILQKGVYFPKQEWHWQRDQTRLIRQESRYRLSAPTLKLQYLNQQEEIGQFLNRPEKKQVQRFIEQLGIPVIHQR